MRNKKGTGHWIEKWRSKNNEKWVHNYTADYIAQRKGEKFASNLRFGRQLTKIRQQVSADLKGDNNKTKQIALIVALIDQALFRVGNEASAKNGAYGVTTLKKRHLRLQKGLAIFSYTGKRGVSQRRVITDERLVRALKTLRRRQDERLWQHEGRPITALDINTYLARFGVTAKQFRTFHATRMTRELLLEQQVHKAERPRAVKAVVTEVAGKLGNSTSACTESYVDPTVVRAYLAGKLGAQRAKTGGR